MTDSSELITLVSGDPISVTSLNSNFELLDENIKELSSNITALNSTMSSNISSINSTITTQIETLTTSIEDIFAIGEPQFSLTGTLNDGEIWLEGAEISCTSYPALYEVYGDTYGTASTDGYFVLPDFRGRVIQGADSFGYIDAGLPDLYGYIGIPSKTSDGSLFYGTRSGDLYDHSSGGGTCQYGKMYFKASNYNSIYGNSDTVQPPAIIVRVKTRYI